MEIDGGKSIENERNLRLNTKNIEDLVLGIHTIRKPYFCTDR